MQTQISGERDDAGLSQSYQEIMSKTKKFLTDHPEGLAKYFEWCMRSQLGDRYAGKLHECFIELLPDVTQGINELLKSAAEGNSADKTLILEAVDRGLKKLDFINQNKKCSDDLIFQNIMRKK